MDMFDRVRLREPDTTVVSDATLKDYIQTITDRLNLRLGTDELPQVFESICVDATVKMVRRTYYEGISTEGVANISTSFVEDILSEYEREITAWDEAHADESHNKVVRFL